MMISPESYIDQLRDKSYEELLEEREKIIKEIREFEKTYNKDSKEELISPSPKTIYICNLLYLGKLCELIVEKYNEEDEE